MKKTYILDTSVIVYNPDILNELNNSKIVIPITSLEELDKLKSQYTIVGANARQFLRKLDDLTSKFENEIELDNDSSLILDATQYKAIGSDYSYGDNKILGCAEHYNSIEKNVVLLSRDYNLRIRARVLKIKSEDYTKDSVLASADEFYTGTKEFEMDPDEIESLYENKLICASSSWIKENNIFPNQYMLLVSQDKSVSATCRLHPDNTIRLIDDKPKVFGLIAKNKEQKYALDALLDDNIKLITLSGIAGTGKTLLATAAALEQVVNQKKYEKFVITKSIETVGKDIGALPGTKLEKMAPFLQSIMDNVGVLMSKSKKKSTLKQPNQNKPRNKDEQVIQDPYLSLLLESGVLEIEAIAYLRGRSIDNAIILIDECQNLTMAQIKTIASRIGNNSKLILNGDLDQIDLPSLNIFNNGLTYIVEKFKEQPIAAHVTLVKGERSELATLASKLL